MSENQLVLDLVQPVRPTLENFVEGPNAAALAAIRDFRAGRGPQFLYVWGEHGSGCSHLMQALGAGQGVPRWKGTGIYAVDAVEELAAAQHRDLFVLMNEVRADPASRLACSGSVPPAQASPRADVATRLGWGLVLEIFPLSDEDKVQALAAMAHRRGWNLTAEMSSWMLAHLPRDMRSLVATVNAVDEYALELKRPVTLPLMRQWLAAQAAR